MTNSEQQVDLTLNPPEELIGVRDFAKLVGVAHPSIVEAIDIGRISSAAVIKTRRGRKLRKELALQEWRQLHDVVGIDEPEGRQIDRPYWYRWIPNDPERNLDEKIGDADRDLEFCLRQAGCWISCAAECNSSVKGLLERIREIDTKIDDLHAEIIEKYYGPEHEH